MNRRAIFITSHHTKKTDAGLSRLCIREITFHHTTFINTQNSKYVTLRFPNPDAMEICSLIVQYFLI